MKQSWKRFMAHVLVVAMVICGLPASYTALKAKAETTADETTRLRIYEGRQTGYLDGKAIYLQTEGTDEAPYLPAADGYVMYEPVEGEGGVYYHDTLVNVPIRKYGANAYLFDINLYNQNFRQLVKDESLTVKGKFRGRKADTDAWYVVEFKEVTFRYEGGTTWSEVCEPAEDTEIITLSDFNIGEKTLAKGENVASTKNYYTGSLDEKCFRMKMTRSEDSTGNTRIYYGDAGYGNWKNYAVDIGSDSLIIRWWDSSVTTFKTITLSKYGIDASKEMVIDFYLQKVDTDGNGVDDANLIVVINGILLADDNVMKDCWSKITSHILIYSDSNTVTTIANADSNIEQITLSDFGIADGVMENSTMGEYTGGIESKEVLLNVTHTVADTAAVNSYARLYFGTRDGNDGGFMIGIRQDHYIIVFDGKGEMLSAQSLTESLGIKDGETFALKLYLTYIDADNDGNKDDANLDVYVNGQSIGAGKNIINDAVMNNWMRFYMNDGHTLQVDSVAKKETTPQVSLGDFGINNGTYGDGQDLVYGTCNNALAGKRFQVEITPHTTTGGDNNYSFIYYASQYEGARTGFRIGVRGDGYLIIHNLTSIASVKGVAAGSMLTYPTLNSLGLAMGDTFALEAFLDYVDYDGDGCKDDAYIRVKVESKVILEDYFVDAALKLGNAMDVWGHTGNTVELKHVYDTGEVANPFRFQGVDERSYIDADGNAVIEVAPSIGIPGNPDVEGYENVAVYNGLSVLVGETERTYAMTKTDHGTFRFVIPKADVPALPFTVTLQRGAMMNSDETVELNLKSDYIVYVNAYGISGGTYITSAGDDVALAYASGSAEGIYLTATDTMTVTGWTGSHIYAADDINSGFFLNGERHQEVYLKKYEEGKYYIPLSESEIIPEEGDVAILTGKFELDTVFVDFATWVAKWNGTTWEVLAGTTIAGGSVSRDTSDDEWLVDGSNATVNENPVDQGTVLYKPGDYTVKSTFGDVTMEQTVSLYHPGDVDVNNAYDVADLVRVKKHQNNGTAETAAGQLAADKADLSTLRRILIGKTKVDDTLPTEMIGATTAGTYITAVDATANGTTVISMADSDNHYQASAEQYDDYGFDYVIDCNNDRGLKILQLTDTQTVDSSQMRSEDRLGQESIEAWAPDKIEENVFAYIKATIEAAQPDLILLTGDIIYGEFDDNGSQFKQIVEYMDGFRIPWAPVYGNHDNESCMGVEWQNKLLSESTYCLFNPRHDIEGNGNYSIGISHNGTLERVVYMMDSNGCYEPWWIASKYKDTEEARNADTTAVKMSQGFSVKQKNWYRTTALRTNAIAGKTIPSFVAYHISSAEYLAGAKAACYQSGVDSNDISYTIGKDVTAQPGDSGYKGAERFLTREEPYFLDYMHEVGTDGTFVGHQHAINTSIYYDGIRWTYGVKTGTYVYYPPEMGGTLVKLSSDSSVFEVERIIVNP